MPAPLPGGIWGFPVSPFSGDDALDLEGLVTGCTLQVHGGVSALVVNGALAEVDALAPAEWLDALSAACAAEPGVPVIAALPTDREAALHAARAAQSLPIAALLVLPGTESTSAELVDRARRAVELAGAPAVVYQRGTVRLAADDLAPAVAAGAVVGIKDGTRDLRSLRRLMESFGRDLTFAAAFEDMTLAYWALGVDTLCPASTAHDPAYSRRWLQLLQAGDIAAARTLLQQFGYPFTDLRFSRPGIDVAVVKRAMALRGVPAGAVRAPGVAPTADETQRVAELVDRLDSAAVKW